MPSSYNILSHDNPRIPSSRKPVILIALSSLLLLVVIILALLVSRHSPSPPPIPPSSSCSIKSLCSSTLYPSSCLSSLSPFLSNSSLDPPSLLRLALQSAQSAISVSSSLLRNQTNSPCNQLLTLASSHIDDCLTSSSNLTSHAVLDDLNTWLSAAITDHQTCLDELDQPINITTKLNYSTQITSNALSILKQISKFVNLGDFNVKFGKRRLMSVNYGDSFKYNANLVVAKDGSGNYATIGAALAKVPRKSGKRFVIYVKKGVYYENVRVEQNMWNVVVVGDGMNSTVVSGRLNAVDGTPTFQSATFAVFGKGFVAIDMAFRNTAGPIKQQAVAVLASADLIAFHRCKFDAYQDTLYAHSLRQFYRDCHIFGTVDFIFGNAASVFQSCSILPKRPIKGQQVTITAQGKSDPNQNTGISIINSTIWPSENLNSVSVYLGRPWKAYATVVFMRSTMNGFVEPAGWLPWLGPAGSVPDTIFYSEYENYGPGASLINRVKWKGVSVMNAKQAEKFTVRGFIKGDFWISKMGIPYASDF